MEAHLTNTYKKNSSIEADRLMLTGPGKTKRSFVSEHRETYSHTIYDLETFWQALKEKKISGSGKIAIIGAGEHAASALLALSHFTRGKIASKLKKLLNKTEMLIICTYS